MDFLILEDDPRIHRIVNEWMDWLQERMRPDKFRARSLTLGDRRSPLSFPNWRAVAIGDDAWDAPWRGRTPDVTRGDVVPELRFRLAAGGIDNPDAYRDIL